MKEKEVNKMSKKVNKTEKPVAAKPVASKPAAKVVKNEDVKIVQFKMGTSRNPNGCLIVKGKKAYYMGPETYAKFEAGKIKDVEVDSGYQYEGYCRTYNLDLVEETMEL